VRPPSQGGRNVQRRDETDILTADINISLLKGKEGIMSEKGKKKDPDGCPGLGEEEALLFFG